VLGNLAGWLYHFECQQRAIEHGVSRPGSDTLKRLTDSRDVSGDYLLVGSTAEAAKARFEGRELWRQFQGAPAGRGQDCRQKKIFMEQIATLHIEKLPEGVYLATSEDIPGLVAQGRTIQETLEIARDVGKKLLEAKAERTSPPTLPPAADSFDYPLIIGG